MVDEGGLEAAAPHHQALLGLSYWLNGDWGRATVHLRLAQELGPSLSPVAVALAPLIEIGAGSLAAADELIARAEELLAPNPWIECVEHLQVARVARRHADPSSAARSSEYDGMRHRVSALAERPRVHQPRLAGARRPRGLLGRRARGRRDPRAADDHDLLERCAVDPRHGALGPGSGRGTARSRQPRPHPPRLGHERQHQRPAVLPGPHADRPRTRRTRGRRAGRGRPVPRPGARPLHAPRRRGVRRPGGHRPPGLAASAQGGHCTTSG